MKPPLLDPNRDPQMGSYVVCVCVWAWQAATCNALPASESNYNCVKLLANHNVT